MVDRTYTFKHFTNINSFNGYKSTLHYVLLFYSHFHLRKLTYSLSLDKHRQHSSCGSGMWDVNRDSGCKICVHQIKEIKRQTHTHLVLLFMHDALECCDRLQACASPKFLCCDLIPSVMGYLELGPLGGEEVRGGSVNLNGISALIKRCSFCSVRPQKKSAICGPGREMSSDIEFIGAFSLGFSRLQSYEKQVSVVYKPPSLFCYSSMDGLEQMSYKNLMFFFLPKGYNRQYK